MKLPFARRSLNECWERVGQIQEESSFNIKQALPADKAAEFDKLLDDAQVALDSAGAILQDYLEGRIKKK